MWGQEARLSAAISLAGEAKQQVATTFPGTVRQLATLAVLFQIVQK